MHPVTGKVTSLDEAVEAERRNPTCQFFTTVREGSQRAAYVTACKSAGSVKGFNYNGGITIPYKGKSGAPYFNYEGQQDANPLTGQALKDQLDRWVNYGTMEADAVSK